MAVKSFSEIIAERKAAAAAGTPMEPIKAAQPALAEASPAPPLEVKESPANPFLAALKRKAEEATTPSPIRALSPAPLSNEAPVVADTSPLPKIITAANLLSATKEVKTEASLEAGAEDLNPSQMEAIRQKIHDMQTMEGFDLKTAADTLKGMLRANPSACQYMLPEDSGLIVRALRRMTGNHQAAAMANAKPVKKGKEKDLFATPLTAAEIAAALDEF